MSSTSSAASNEGRQAFVDMLNHVIAVKAEMNRFLQEMEKHCTQKMKYIEEKAQLEAVYQNFTQQVQLIYPRMEIELVDGRPTFLDDQNFIASHRERCQEIKRLEAQVKESRNALLISNADDNQSETNEAEAAQAPKAGKAPKAPESNPPPAAGVNETYIMKEMRERRITRQQTRQKPNVDPLPSTSAMEEVDVPSPSPSPKPKKKQPRKPRAPKPIQPVAVISSPIVDSTTPKTKKKARGKQPMGKAAK